MKLACKKCNSTELQLVREVFSRTSYSVNHENVVSEEDNDYWDRETEVVECIQCEARHSPTFDEDNESLILEINLLEK